MAYLVGRFHNSDYILWPPLASAKNRQQPKIQQKKYDWPIGARDSNRFQGGLSGLRRTIRLQGARVAALFDRGGGGSWNWRLSRGLALSLALALQSALFTLFHFGAHLRFLFGGHFLVFSLAFGTARLPLLRSHSLPLIGFFGIFGRQGAILRAKLWLGRHHSSLSRRRIHRQDGGRRYRQHGQGSQQATTGKNRETGGHGMAFDKVLKSVRFAGSQWPGHPTCTTA